MKQESNSLAETDCLSNSSSFADLIQREVLTNLRRHEEEKKHYLVLKKYIPTFSEEIRCMMHTHGDVAGPLPESVLLVGTILRDQMNMLLIKATEASNSIKGQLTHENILQVLRENKGKLKRLLFYLKLRDMKDCFYKKKPLMEDEEEKPADNISASSSHMLTKLVDRPEYGRRVRTCLEFLRKTDGTFDCASIMENSAKDPISMRRQTRRYLITLNMSDAEYLEYSRKLQASFYPKNGGKLFLKWLLVDKVTHLVPNELALEMINYLAYETVAEIVDMSLQLKYNRNPAKHSKENIYVPTSLSESAINTGSFACKRKFQDKDDCDSISCGSVVENANSTLLDATTSKASLNVEREIGKSMQNSSAKDGSNFLKRHEFTPNEECMMSLNESIMPNDFPINTCDAKSLSKQFGDEFKDGVKKEPITPEIIKEVLDLCSGSNKHKYNVQWKKAKGCSLLCTQDYYTISLQRH